MFPSWPDSVRRILDAIAIEHGNAEAQVGIDLDPGKLKLKPGGFLPNILNRTPISDLRVLLGRKATIGEADRRAREATPAAQKADQDRKAREARAAEQKAETDRKAREVKAAEQRAETDRKAREAKAAAQKAETDRKARKAQAAEPKAETDHKAREAKAAEQKGLKIKVGRNDPCPCGSGKKYKRCHGYSTEVPTTPPKRPDGSIRAGGGPGSASLRVLGGAPPIESQQRGDAYTKASQLLRNRPAQIHRRTPT
jgi:uncharacterized protein YchJ